MKPPLPIGILLATLVGLVFGCGGTSTTEVLPPGAEDATLKVKVVENDGETTGLDGHVFTVVQTGETATSDEAGVVPFGPIPPGSLTLHMGNGPVGSTASIEVLDDDDAASLSEVSIERVQARETIEVRVHVRNATMQCVRISRELHGACDVEIALDPTEANDDPDMTGALDLESNVDRQRFCVEVLGADPDRVLELVVLDTQGNEESQGTRIVDALGQAIWSLDTSEGDALPLDVENVHDLEDFGVEVRDAVTGAALLVANVPEMPPAAGGDGGDAFRGCALLTAVEAGLSGYVEIASREDGACQSFHMEVQGLAVGREVELLVEDPTTPDVYLSLGTRTGHGALGLAHLGLSTSTGDALPGGVDSVAELVGLRVEVRASPGSDVLLFGIIPELVAD